MIQAVCYVAEPAVPSSQLVALEQERVVGRAGREASGDTGVLTVGDVPNGLGECPAVTEQPHHWPALEAPERVIDAVLPHPAVQVVTPQRSRTDAAATAGFYSGLTVCFLRLPAPSSS